MRYKNQIIMLKIIGNFFLDIAKFTFAGIIVGAIMRQDYPFELLMRRGAAFMLATFATGIIFHFYRNHLKHQ